MREKSFAIWAFTRYWLLKEDRYSQQSPFVFSVYSDLLRFLKTHKKGDTQIERFRKNLLDDHSRIQVLDLGAGSKKVPSTIRKVSAICRYSTSGAKFAQLYQFFCAQTPAKYVLELGTCLGISTRYLCKAVKGTLFTFEGSPEIQKVAQRAPTPDQTSFILGAISTTLPIALDQIPQVDFALIDANHTYEGTMYAFECILSKVHSQTIIAIGDIHWNIGMEQAWMEIKQDRRVNLTFDFYECGIVFFDSPGEKTDLILEI